MKIKQQFSDYLQKVKQTLSSLELNNELDKASNVSQKIQQGELIVPVVGGFSSGKSTLINSFLGNPLLPTSVRPETALAAELRYSEEEYIIAVKGKTTTRYSISQLPEIKDNNQQFDYLKIYLNNANLKQISPLVLVDMPGFGAFNEEHNKAISTYYVRGNYFVFLTDCAAGTITRDMERTIENLQQYGTDFSFCLSKTNLRTKSDVDNVAEEIKEQLEGQFDYTKELVRLALNGGENLKKILMDINPEDLFKQVYQPELVQLHGNLRSAVNTRLATLKAEKEEIAEVQERLQKQIENLGQRQKNTLLRVQDYAQSSTKGVINRIYSKLLEQQGVLVATAMRSQAEFGNELNELVKDVSLRELKAQFEKIREEAISDIEEEISANFSGIGGLTFSNFANELKLDPIKTSEPTIAPIPTDSGMLNTIKNVADVIGTLFPVFKPVAKVVSVIASVASAIFGSSEVRQSMPQVSQADIEANQRRQIETQYQTVILPKIKYELESKLPDTLKENIQSLIDEINRQFSDKVQAKQREIEQEVQNQSLPQAEIDKRIEGLTQAGQALDKLSEQYLC